MREDQHVFDGGIATQGSCAFGQHRSHLRCGCEALAAHRELRVGIQPPERHAMPAVVGVRVVSGGCRAGGRARREAEDLPRALVPAFAADEEADHADAGGAPGFQRAYPLLERVGVGHAPGDLERVVAVDRRERSGDFAIPLGVAAVGHDQYAETVLRARRFGFARLRAWRRQQ